MIHIPRVNVLVSQPIIISPSSQSEYITINQSVSQSNNLYNIRCIPENIQKSIIHISPINHQSISNQSPINDQLMTKKSLINRQSMVN